MAEEKSKIPTATRWLTCDEGERLEGDIWTHGPELVAGRWRKGTGQDGPSRMELPRMKDIFGIRPEDGCCVAVNIQQWFGGIDIGPGPHKVSITGPAPTEVKPGLRNPAAQRGHFKDCDVEGGVFEDCVFERVHLRGGEFDGCIFDACTLDKAAILKDGCVVLGG